MANVCCVVVRFVVGCKQLGVKKKKHTQQRREKQIHFVYNEIRCNFQHYCREIQLVNSMDFNKLTSMQCDRKQLNDNFHFNQTNCWCNHELFAITQTVMTTDCVFFFSLLNEYEIYHRRLRAKRIDSCFVLFNWLLRQWKLSPIECIQCAKGLRAIF